MHVLSARSRRASSDLTAVDVKLLQKQFEDCGRGLSQANEYYCRCAMELGHAQVELDDAKERKDMLVR